MRRFYVVPKAVWEEPIDFGGGMMLPRYNLFALRSGSSGIHLDEKSAWLLLSTDFDVDWQEEMWHAHPEVARIAHPTREGDVKLIDLHRNPKHAHKQFKQHHWDLLVAKFGLDQTHTVWDLHDRARAIDPDCRLSNVY